MTSQSTHFGYQSVAKDEKQNLVDQVFTSVSKRYDLMNDLMSLGVHRFWKIFAIEQAYLRAGENIMDLAGGTGHLTQLINQKMNGQCPITLIDYNYQMISEGRSRLIDQNNFKNVTYVQANAELLPVKSNSFDCILISFGLRNVTNIDKAIASMYEALKPGGRLIILEFSKANLGWLNHLYDLYSFQIIPKLGHMVVGDEQSYQYLVESIRMHPNQEELKQIILQQGFDQCDYFNLTGGIVAVHRAYKY